MLSHRNIHMYDHMLLYILYEVSHAIFEKLLLYLLSYFIPSS